MGIVPARKRARRRSAGEGSVYRTADGRWRGTVTWTEPDGRRQRRYVSARTSTEARDKIDDLRREHRLGGLTAPGRLTVGQFLATWIERDRGRVRPSTWRSRETHVRVYLVPALGRQPLVRLTAPDVERAIGAFMASGRPERETTPRRGRPSTHGISAMTARHVRTTLWPTPSATGW